MGEPSRTPFSFSKLLACVATCVYFALAAFRIDFQSIWYDEGLTLHYSSLPLIDGLGELAQRSVHPPLYFALMHFWLKLAGDSDFALRLPSAAFGALLVAASFVLGSRLANQRLGATLAFITAASPFVVYYGQEARMYTAVAFFATVSAVQAIKIAKYGKGFLGYGLASAIAALTHYFAFLIIGSEVIILAPILLFERRRRDLAKVLGALVVVVLLFAPWALSFFRVAATHEDFWRKKLSLISMIQDSALHFSLGEVAWPDNFLIYIFYMAVAVGLVCILRKGLRLAVFVATSTLLVSFSILVVFPKATYVARYMLVVAPAFYLLVALGVNGLGSFVALVHPKRSIPEKAAGYFLTSAGVALALSLLGADVLMLLFNYYDPAAFRREDYRSLAAYMEPKTTSGDGMVFVAGPLGYSLFHYLHASMPSVWVDSNARLKSDDPLPDLAEFLNRDDVKRVWLVRSRVGADDLVDPDRITRERVMKRFGVMTALKDVRGLVVEEYDRDLYDQFNAGMRVNITYSDEVRLARYSVSSEQLKRGDKFNVELFWEPARPVNRLLWVSLQLVSRASGQMVALADFPAGGLVPTTTWGPGMRVADKVQLAIPIDASAGDYDAYLIVYDPATQTRLAAAGPLPDQRGDAARLFSVKVGE